MVTDAELLSRYANERSEAAFREIVGRHLNGVYRAALRQLEGDTHLAEEVSQLVFTHLARKAGSLSPSVVLAGWLYSTTRYTVANVRRAEYRRRRREQEIYRMREDELESDQTVDWAQLRPVLDDALWELKAPDRDAVLLRFFENQSYRDIAAALSVTEDAARMRVDRALHRLREGLARRKVGSSLAALEAAFAAQASFAAPAGLATTVMQNAMALPALPGPLSAALHFMATSKTVLIGVACVALLAVGTAVHEVERIYLAKADADSAEQDYAAAVTLQRHEMEAVRSTEQTVAQRQRAAEASAAQAPEVAAEDVARTAAAPAAAADDPNEQGKELMARHPEIRTALADYLDAGTRSDYGELYRSLGLTPEQIRQFEALKRVGRGFGRTVPSGTVNLSLDSPQPPLDIEAQLEAMLGPDGYKRYQAYTAQLPARSIAVSLASLTVDTAAPLTSEQAQQVVHIFADALDPKSSSHFDWDKALTAAAVVLSPPQLEALQSLRVRADGWAKVVEAIRL